MDFVGLIECKCMFSVAFLRAQVRNWNTRRQRGKICMEWHSYQRSCYEVGDFKI